MSSWLFSGVVWSQPREEHLLPGSAVDWGCFVLFLLFSSVFSQLYSKLARLRCSYSTRSLLIAGTVWHHVFLSSQSCLPHFVPGNQRALPEPPALPLLLCLPLGQLSWGRSKRYTHSGIVSSTQKNVVSFAGDWAQLKMTVLSELSPSWANSTFFSFLTPRFYIESQKHVYVCMA